MTFVCSGLFGLPASADDGHAGRRLRRVQGVEEGRGALQGRSADQETNEAAEKMQVTNYKLTTVGAAK